MQQHSYASARKTADVSNLSGDLDYRSERTPVVGVGTRDVPEGVPAFAYAAAVVAAQEWLPPCCNRNSKSLMA